MKVRVIRVPDCDTRITRNNSGFASCYPKFPNKIRVSGIPGSGSGIPGSGFGLRVFCPALASPALTQRCSDVEERYTQSQVDLIQVSAFLDSARTLNSSLNAQLDSERMAHEVDFPNCFCFAPSLRCLVLFLPARGEANASCFL
jgi:hypothetical protein